MTNGTDNEASEQGLTRLEQVLDRVQACADGKSRVSIGDMVEALGPRSFAPLILVPGLIMLAPGIGDIPGVPVLMGLLVILVVGQMLMGRRHVWLPDWLLRRSAGAGMVQKTLSWLRKPARFTDRWTHARYRWAVRHGGFVVIAVACIAISMATPVMEVVPFSANLAGVVITAFGLALVSQDGLIGLLAMAAALATGALLLYHLA